MWNGLGDGVYIRKEGAEGGIRHGFIFFSFLSFSLTSVYLPFLSISYTLILVSTKNYLLGSWIFGICFRSLLILILSFILILEILCAPAMRGYMPHYAHENKSITAGTTTTKT